MISSQANPRVKRVIKLISSAKTRAAEQVFIAEGSKLFLEAPPEQIREVYVSHTFRSSLDEHSLTHVRRKLAAFPYEIVSDSVFGHMSDTQSPQGILCVAARCHHELAALLGADRPMPPLYLILADLRDPGNLGTIIRSAEAAGVSAVIIGRGCADITGPKAVRATMGSIFRVPHAYADDLTMVIDALKGMGVEIYAACPDAATPYDGCDYRPASAFLIGSESHGLSEDIRSAARTIAIPMAGAVESLNAATAAAVLLYEAARQRRVT